ncbi:MAG: hypothetical protein ACRDUA_06965 [Micromonosporaceae bacterium]
MSTSTSENTTASRVTVASSRGEWAIRVAGGILVCWLAVVSAVVEAFLVPLRVGSTRVPVALLLAVVCNLVLPRLAHWLTRSRLVTMLPAVTWFLVILIFAGGTSEGDIVLAGNDWVGMVLLLAGSASAAAGAYFALLRVKPSRLRGIARPGR